MPLVGGQDTDGFTTQRIAVLARASASLASSLHILDLDITAFSQALTKHEAQSKPSSARLPAPLPFFR
jgi:hypothetical protein